LIPCHFSCAGSGATDVLNFPSIFAPGDTKRVPLKGNDPDVRVDLQAIFNQCYEDGKFERNIDYSKPPEPRLSKDDAIWAAALLKQKKR